MNGSIVLVYKLLILSRKPMRDPKFKTGGSRRPSVEVDDLAGKSWKEAQLVPLSSMLNELSVAICTEILFWMRRCVTNTNAE